MTSRCRGPVRPRSTGESPAFQKAGLSLLSRTGLRRLAHRTRSRGRRRCRGSSRKSARRLRTSMRRTMFRKKGYIHAWPHIRGDLTAVGHRAGVTLRSPHVPAGTPPAQSFRPSRPRPGCRRTAPRSPASPGCRSRGRICPPWWLQDLG